MAHDLSNDEVSRLRSLLILNEKRFIAHSGIGHGHLPIMLSAQKFQIDLINKIASIKIQRLK